MSMETIGAPLIAGVMQKFFGNNDVPQAPTAEQAMTPLQKAVYPQIQEAITKNMKANDFAKQAMSIRNQKINPKAQLYSQPATTSPATIASNVISQQGSNAASANLNELMAKFKQNPGSLSNEERMRLQQGINMGQIRNY